MEPQTGANELMSFAPAKAAGDTSAIEPWKVLVVDDDEEIHKVTRLAVSSVFSL